MVSRGTDVTPPTVEGGRQLGPGRRQQILEVIHRQGSVHVDALSEQFGVSKVTIRGDLDWLAEQQLVGRARGGAIALSSQTLSGRVYAEANT